MLNLQAERRKVNGRTLLTTAFATAQAALQQRLSEHVNEPLVVATEYLLGRSAYARRAGVPPYCEQSGRCCQCHSHRGDHFSRNGYRNRS